MLCALIMAGGKGTRFWPLSTEEKPKQFLNLIGEDTMIQMSVKRIKKLIPIERIFIVTGKKYESLVKEQLPNLPHRNIIIEPVGKNTAPCIALSAFHINQIYKDATIAVLPSDHLIKDETEFLEVLNSAREFVEINKAAIVTIGMKPDRPETAYGYINYSSTHSIINGYEIRSVKEFVEKPNLEKAKEYLQDGSYLWNGGIFIWKAVNILRLTNKHLENTFNILNEIVATNEENYKRVLEEKYNEIDSVSVDYGIMEKADNIYVIPGEFGWDDVGSWSAVERYIKKDESDNLYLGDVKNIEASNNIVFSNKKPIMLVGISNIFVVESDDMIFISTKEKINDIDEIKGLPGYKSN